MWRTSKLILPVTIMYKVTNTLTSAYGPQDMDLRSKQGPVSLLKYINQIVWKFHWSEKVMTLSAKIDLTHKTKCMTFSRWLHCIDDLKYQKLIRCPYLPIIYSKYVSKFLFYFYYFFSKWFLTCPNNENGLILSLFKVVLDMLFLWDKKMANTNSLQEVLN